MVTTVKDSTYKSVSLEEEIDRIFEEERVSHDCSYERKGKEKREKLDVFEITKLLLMDSDQSYSKI